MRYAAIKEQEETYNVRLMCSLLSVSPSGYYRWKTRPSSLRSRRNTELLAKIVAIHENSRQTYGSPRIHAQLRRDGEQISLRRVVRIMRRNGIAVKLHKRYKATTNSKHKHPVAQNHLNRVFAPQDICAKNCYWAGDITYVATAEGWLYVAVVIDLFSRRVVGWAMSASMESELVTNALEMAFSGRSPSGGVLYHSDRGVQYAGSAAQQQLKEYKMICSMSRKGNCWDNAVIESWNGTFKTELIHRQRWQTRESARAAIYEYIEVWYNRKRIHSTLNYLSPEEFEIQEGQRAIACSYPPSARSSEV
jgi:transposase InsO family protein